MESTILEIFLQDTQGMDEQDAFLRVLTNKKDVEKEYHEKYGDGIRNYPESCMESMIDAEDRVHGI